MAPATRPAPMKASPTRPITCSCARADTIRHRGSEMFRTTRQRRWHSWLIMVLVFRAIHNGFYDADCPECRTSLCSCRRRPR
jgi:hypothetical protein